MPMKPVDRAIKVILGPCIDDVDFKTREESIAYNAAGMEIDVILEKADGTVTTTAVTPTTSGDYDWAHTDQGYYELELPASGGASYNNDEEGILTVVGYVTGVLPFRSVAYDVVPQNVYDSNVKGDDKLQVDLTQIDGLATNGNNATLNLKQLNIVNNAGDALVASSTGSDGHGIKSSANGAGSGILAVGGGDAGNGFEILADAAVSDNQSHGMRVRGTGTGAGADFTGGGSSGNGMRIAGDNNNNINNGNHGLRIISGSGVSGDSIHAESLANDGNGFTLIGNGTGLDISAAEIGTPIALDGGTASLAGMLTKIADDNGGADFDATIHSLWALKNAIGNIGSTGGASNFAAETDNTGGAIKGVAFVGVETSGSYTDTANADGVYHNIDDTGNVIDIVYQFDVGGGRTANEIVWIGYLNGGNDDAVIQAYNYNTTSWDTVGLIDGKGGSSNDTITALLTADYTGSGSDLGKALVRILDAAGTNPSLYTDQLIVSAINNDQVFAYEDGRIWVSSNGTSGTEAGVNGRAGNPVNNWADALTLNNALNLNRFHIGAGAAITLSANSDNYNILGYGSEVDINGQSVSGINIEGATILGDDDGSNSTASSYYNCIMDGNTLGLHRLIGCGIGGDMVIAEPGTYDWVDCQSRVAGTATPSVDFGAAVANVNLNMRNYSGGIEVKNMGQSGTDNMSLEGQGQLVLNANCAGGTIAIRGNFGPITDNASAAVTLVETGNISSMQGKTYAAASFDRSTDSLEAIRDRGDAAWISASSSAPQVLQNTTIATLASQTSFTLTAGSADDDAYNGCMIVITDASTSVQKATGLIKDYTGGTKTITLAADPGVFTMAVGDTVDVIANLSDMQAINRQPTDDNLADLKLKSIDVQNSAGNAVNFESGGGNGAGFRVRGEGSGHGLDSKGGATGDGAKFEGGDTSGNGITSQADSEGNGYGMYLKAQSSDKDGIYAEGGTNEGSGMRLKSIGNKTGGAGLKIETTADNHPAIFALSALDDAVQYVSNGTNTAGILIRGNGTGRDIDAGEIGAPTDLGEGASISSMLDAMANATNGANNFDQTTDSLEAIRNRGDAAWSSASGHPDVLENTTIATLASQTSFTLTAGSADDDAYNGAMVVVTDAVTAVQKAVGTVDTYTGATKTIVLREDPGVFTMAVGDSIAVIAKKDGVDANLTQIEGSSTIDGESLTNFFEKVQAVNYGKVVRSGDNYKYRNQADDADLVDYDVSATGRTIN